MVFTMVENGKAQRKKCIHETYRKWQGSFGLSCIGTVPSIVCFCQSFVVSLYYNDGKTKWQGHQSRIRVFKDTKNRNQFNTK
jgi:hypothetical protein